MNMIGFRGAIYRTEYAMICQPMTRVTHPLQYDFSCFYLLWKYQRNKKNMYN